MSLCTALAGRAPLARELHSISPVEDKEVVVSLNGPKLPKHRIISFNVLSITDYDGGFSYTILKPTEIKRRFRYSIVGRYLLNPFLRIELGSNSTSPSLFVLDLCQFCNNFCIDYYS